MDDEFRQLQIRLLAEPECGKRIPGGGGLRKLRLGDARRNKGTRGGLRIIYYWWPEGRQFWLYTIYGKNEATDMTAPQLAQLTALLKAEIEARRARWQVH